MRTQELAQPRLGSLPLTVRQPVKAACGLCRFHATARTQTAALKGWTDHRWKAHGWRPNGGRNAAGHN
jgi:hypothetical protein